MDTPRNDAGLALIELLIAALLAGIITIAAFHFLVSQHDGALTQESVTDLQQNVRAAMREVSTQLRNAGANVPEPLAGILSRDANPDTLELRYAEIGGRLDVGDHTQKLQAAPIHVAMGSDLSGFNVGDKVFLWHVGAAQGEWFDITKIATNAGSGWEEVHHQGQELLLDPLPGDLLIKLREFKYYIDGSDTLHPVMMRSASGGVPQVFADNIRDFQLEFVKSNGDTVQSVTAADTVLTATITLVGRSERIDPRSADLGIDMRRERTLTTQVLLRNNR